VVEKSIQKTVQSKLEDFQETESNEEALNRIARNHVTKMAQILNEIFEKLFNEKYVEEI